MAWWLDPKNHPVPRDGSASQSGIRPNFTLPDGIDRIVVIDPQMALLVFGTDAGVEELRQTIQFLDRPPRKIETAVAARLVTINTAQLSGIWAALATQNVGEAPGAAILSEADKTQFGGWVMARTARVEGIQSLQKADGSAQTLFFAPVPARAPQKSVPSPLRDPNFSSPMPVVPFPQGMAPMPTGNNRLQLQSDSTPLEPLRFRLSATPGEGGIVRLQIQNMGPVLGSWNWQNTSVLHPGETLCLALPTVANSTKQAFLLLETAQILGSSNDKIPLLRDLPGIGGLFKQRVAPQNVPRSGE